jgi:hypothetical protein
MKKSMTLFFIMISIIVNNKCSLISPKTNSYTPLKDEVIIFSGGIRFPIGRIFLIKKKSEIYAAKFTQVWNGKLNEDWYAEYIVYSGDFINKKLKQKTNELSTFRPRGIGRFAFNLGDNSFRCGQIKLLWDGPTMVCFYELGQYQYPSDYSELAPTIWKEISEVDIKEPRIKWYRYNNEIMGGIRIPIDQLWENIDNK